MFTTGSYKQQLLNMNDNLAGQIPNISHGPIPKLAIIFPLTFAKKLVFSFGICESDEGIPCIII